MPRLFIYFFILRNIMGFLTPKYLVSESLTFALCHEV